MKKKVIAVTGAGGFLGSAIAAFFERHQYRVIRLLRQVERSDEMTRQFNLAREYDSSILAGADILIHCAYDKNGDHPGSGLNFTGSRHLFELANKAGVKQIIFLSSVAAQASIESFYGKSKMAIGALLDTSRDTIVKPGLVIGNGGLFQRILQTAITKKWVPVIGKGDQALQVISLHDLVNTIGYIAEKGTSGSFVLVNNERFTYREFFSHLGSFYKKKLRFIRVGKKWLLGIVSIGKKLGMHLPVTRENIMGISSQQLEEPLFPNPIKPSTLKEALEQLIKDQR